MLRPVQVCIFQWVSSATLDDRNTKEFTHQLHFLRKQYMFLLLFMLCHIPSDTSQTCLLLQTSMKFKSVLNYTLLDRCRHWDHLDNIGHIWLLAYKLCPQNIWVTTAQYDCSRKKKYVAAEEVSKPLFSNFGVLQTRVYFGKRHRDWMLYWKARVKQWFLLDRCFQRLLFLGYHL